LAEHTVAREMYKILARSFQGDASFGEVLEASLAAGANFSMDANDGQGEPLPALGLYKAHGSAVQLYHGEIEMGHLSAWLRHSSLPLIHELGLHNFKSVVGAGQSAALLFVEETAQHSIEQLARRHDVAALLLPTALRLSTPSGWVGGYTSPLSFSVVLAPKFWRFAENVGVNLARLPDLVLLEGNTGVTHTWSEGQPDDAVLTPEALDIFCEDFIGGRMTVPPSASTLASSAAASTLPLGQWAEEPMQRLRIITVAPGRYTDTVNMAGDILMLLYAPWCGFCTAFAATWIELAELSHREIEAARLTFAVLDTTVHDPPLTVPAKRLPSLLLYREGSKEHPLVYSGANAVRPLLDFLKANCTAWEPYAEDSAFNSQSNIKHPEL